MEERRIAIALTGQRHPQFWSGDDRDAKFDISDLKGLLEEFLEQFGVKPISYARRAEPIRARTGPRRFRDREGRQ